MSRIVFGIILFSFSFSTPASDKVMGTVTGFSSPNNIQEQCIAINSMPGGVYTDADRRLEKEYCSMDIYSNTGICPKTWSTSPGTMFYGLSGSQYSSATQLEASVCQKQRHVPIKAIAFKSTMNMRDTSATFSTASLLYYHFSRYFDTQIKVPVAVFRSIDRQAHLQRVTHKGIAYTKSHMIHDAWKDMLEIETSPASYHPVDELFTADRKQIYGALVGGSGKRYSGIINGSRKSSWGEGQSNDFQKTPPFLALSSEKPVAQAVALHEHKATKEQMVFWMQDLTEITLLDYIFSQQDRIGNIDFTKVWVSTSDGHIKRSEQPPAEDQKAQLIKQTHINDNDAGGRYAYANFTKKTKMLENIRHYNRETFQQLMKLDDDFARQGVLYEYLSQAFGLSTKQRDMIVKNTRLAAEILRNNCLREKLTFDLKPEQFFIRGTVDADRVQCDAYSQPGDIS